MAAMSSNLALTVNLLSHQTGVYGQCYPKFAANFIEKLHDTKSTVKTIFAAKITTTPITLENKNSKKLKNIFNAIANPNRTFWLWPNMDKRESREYIRSRVTWSVVRPAL